MQQKLLRRSIFHTPLFILSLFVLLLTSCNHGVTIHPSKLTPEMRKECAAALAGLYDTKVRVISSIAGTEREVKIENGKRVEYFESQDSTLQLKTTILDYDNGMKLILHNFPLSTIAKALPDSLGDLRTAIAEESDKELTVNYNFGYSDKLYLSFEPQDLSFTCQTKDGRQHHLRLCFDSKLLWAIGALEDRILNINLILDSQKMQLSATALYEDEHPLFAFDEWKSDDFYYLIVRFGTKD